MGFEYVGLVLNGGAGMGEKGTLMLHACCGPCAIEPLRLLQEDGWSVAIAYVNPNIHPKPEYEHRLEVLRAYAATQGVNVIEGAYDIDAWMCEVAPLRDDREARCRACYRLRLSETARMAADKAFDAIATTLSVSPYQLTDVIAEELDRAAGGAGIAAMFDDYRAQYPEATRISRDLGMYRQNYCGCMFSEAEAAVEREERRAQRRAEALARARAREAEEAKAAEERARRREERAAYDAEQRRKRAIRDAMRAEAKARREVSDAD